MGKPVMLIGDVMEMLASISDESVDCVVTSPPYWGLRDYGCEGQIGLEPTLAEHLQVMVRVFDQVRRVLKPSGTVWVNYGDCYASSPNGRSAADTKAAGTDDRTFRDKPFSTVQGVLKAKDLCMVPNRFAIAMQEAGWWVRSEIIWAKPNPMPESITDRPATSHEKVFMFTKSAKYFYDAEAVRQRRASTGEYKTPDGWDTGPGAHGSILKTGRNKGETAAQKKNKQRGHGRRHDGFNDRWDQLDKAEQQANGRNLRNYEPAPVETWSIATRPFSGAHFATFPPELVERCLAAGCPKGGHVLDPFGGAGTTGLVADRLQMRATLIELNPDYAEIAEQRFTEDRGALLDCMEAQEAMEV
ncbi:MAG: site-specific DNA-methyltransferase [Pseudomonadota bacterium]